MAQGFFFSMVGLDVKYCWCTSGFFKSSGYWVSICTWPKRQNCFSFDSNDTIFKYNPALQAFSVIEADFLLRNEINKVPIFVFLSKGKNEKYFCKTFFPQDKKDYTEHQTRWTVLFKKKIVKSTNTEMILYKSPKFEIK